jgi:hypothetical protein
LQFTQFAEQFARCPGRLLFLRFGVGLTDQVAKVLAICIGMLRDQLVERFVALGDQAIAPGFKLVQGGGFTMGLLAITIEDQAHGIDLFDFESAQVLGEELGLALACNWLRNAAGAANFLEQVGLQRNSGQLGIGQGGQGFGQLEDCHRIAAQLAATGAVEDVIGFIVGHRISAGNGRSRQIRAAFNGYRG